MFNKFGLTLMKKLFTIFMLLFAGMTYAQNLQVHYDLGKDREYITTTFEMFKPDEYGSTFTFVDFDFNRGGNKSMGLAYWEIARYVNVYKGLAVTAQYNDGMIHSNAANMDFPLGHVWLAGVSYPINLGFVTLTTDLLYRKDYTSEGSDAQLTTVWFVPFLGGKLNFTGFMDVWTKKDVVNNGRDFVLLTEPQLWYNVINHLAVGTEVEISNNFVPGENKVQVNPTVAVKWNF